MATATAAPTPTPAGSGPAAKAASPAAPRRRAKVPAQTRRHTAAPTPRSARVVHLTADGRDALHHRLERLRTEVVAPLGAMIGEPDHDRRIDDDYDRAFAEAAHLEQLLAEAAEVRPPEDRTLVALGSLADLRFSDDSVERLRLVHPAEAFLDDERVSVESPVAKAVLGRRLGDTVDVEAPSGRLRAEIVAVWQPELVLA